MSTINTTMDDLHHSSEQEIGRKKAMRRLTISVLAIITGMAGMTLFSRFQASQNISTAILPVAPQMNATLIPTTDTPTDLSKKLADATMQLQQAKKEEPIRGYANEQPAPDEYIVNKSASSVSNPAIQDKIATVSSKPSITTTPTDMQEAKVATAQQPETPKASTVASNSKESTNNSNSKDDATLGAEKAVASSSGSHPTESEKSTKDAKNSQSTARYAHKNYAVQVGMFSNPNNAQSLQTKLNKAGVRAVVETRVYLGPFNNKIEADDALKKAKEMGLNAVVLAPTKL